MRRYHAASESRSFKLNTTKRHRRSPRNWITVALLHTVLIYTGLELESTREPRSRTLRLAKAARARARHITRLMNYESWRRSRGTNDRSTRATKCAKSSPFTLIPTVSRAARVRSALATTQEGKVTPGKKVHVR